MNHTTSKSKYYMYQRPLSQWSAEALIKEYLEMTRAGFNRMFGHNARGAKNEIATELISRNITEIPNIFGSIQITLNTR